MPAIQFARAVTVCLTLVASGTGFAQPPKEDGVSPLPPLLPAEAAEDPPSRGEVFPRESSYEEDEDDPEAFGVLPRLLLQTAAGTGLGAGTGSTGILVFLYPPCLISLSQGPNNKACEATLVATSVLGTTLGSGFAVYFGGRHMKGHGRAVPTFIGALGGAAFGMSLLIREKVQGGGIWTFLFLPAAISAVSATLMYQASAIIAPARSEPRLRASTSFEVVPLVGATQGGGLIGGLAGQF